MPVDLSVPFQEYYNSFEGVKTRNFPIEYLEKMKNYLIEKYEKNLIEIYEGLFTLVLNPENSDILKILSEEIGKIKEDFEVYNELLENNTTIGDYSRITMEGLKKLIDGLKNNEEVFYKEVLNSDKPNFLITTYYSLYIRFVTMIYLRLRKISLNDPNIKTKDSPLKYTFNIANSIVGFLGMPIVIYIKKREVFPYISELTGALLHVLVANKTPMPSKDSLGYYLFSTIHADNS